MVDTIMKQYSTVVNDDGRRDQHRKSKVRREANSKLITGTVPVRLISRRRDLCAATAATTMMTFAQSS
jgi:hypothetical protein